MSRKRLSSKRALIAIAACVSLVAAACSGSDGAASTSDDEPNPPQSTEVDENAGAPDFEVGVLIFATTVPYLAVEAQAIERTGAECGIEIDVQNGNFDIANQVAIIQDFITQEKDAIVVNASDPDALIPVIRQANDAGIPVFAAAAVLSEGADVISTSAADNFEFGRLQGLMLLDAVGEEAIVAYVPGVLGSPPVIQRREGLMDVIGDFPGIEIVEEQPSNWSDSEALSVIQNYLTKYPEGELDAIIDQGPVGAAGANFARETGRTDVTFIMGDLSEQVKDGILDGSIYGTVLQDPDRQGSDAMENVCNYLHGDIENVVDGFDPTPLEIITIDNAADAPAF